MIKTLKNYECGSFSMPFNDLNWKSFIWTSIISNYKLDK